MSLSVLSNILFSDCLDKNDQENRENLSEHLKTDDSTVNNLKEIYKASADAQNIIDLLKQKKLRRLYDTDYVGSESFRVPKQRYISEKEFSLRLSQKHKSANTWAEKLRQRNFSGFTETVTSNIVDTAFKTPNFKKHFVLNKKSRHHSLVTGCEISPKLTDYSLAYSCGLDKTIKLYSLTPDHRKQTGSYGLQNKLFYKSSFGSDYQSIYVASDEASIFCFDIETQSFSKISQCYNHMKKNTIKKMLAYDNFLFLLDNDGTLRQIDVRTSNEVGTYDSGTKLTDFVVNNEKIIAGDEFADIFHWSLGKSRCIYRKNLPNMTSIECLSLSKRGLIISSKNGILSIFDGIDSTVSAMDYLNFPGLAKNVASNVVSNYALAYNFEKDRNVVKLLDVNKLKIMPFPPKTIDLRKLTYAYMSNDSSLLLGNSNGVVTLFEQ